MSMAVSNGIRFCIGQASRNQLPADFTAILNFYILLRGASFYGVFAKPEPTFDEQ